jgi:hypothetical protein
MKLLIEIAYLSALIVPLLAPVLYKNRRQSMIEFYRRMTVSYSYRRFYTRMLTIFLLAFHFYHLSVYNRPAWVMLSTVLTILTLSHKLCERAFGFIQHRWALTTCCVVALLLMIIPCCLPLGFTILVLAVASLFYPSRLFRDEIGTVKEKLQQWDDDPAGSIFRYFRWSLAEEMEVESKKSKDSKRNRPIILEMPKSTETDSSTRKVQFQPEAVEDVEYIEVMEPEGAGSPTPES